MHNPIFFRAAILDSRYYPDTNQTRVVVKLTHADKSGDADPNTDLRGCQLKTPIIASFRLWGPDALKKYAEYYYQHLPSWQEVRTLRGGVIYFTARAVGEGKSSWYTDPMRVLIGFSPESLSFQHRRKRVRLELLNDSDPVDTDVMVEFEGGKPEMTVVAEDESVDLVEIAADAFVAALV